MTAEGQLSFSFFKVGEYKTARVSEEQFVELWQSQLTIKKIADQLLLNESSIRKRAKTLGLPQRHWVPGAHAPGEKWTPERTARLIEMVDKRYTAAQIANELGAGLTRNAVIGKAERLGLPWGKKRGPRVKKIDITLPKVEHTPFKPAKLQRLTFDAMTVNERPSLPTSEKHALEELKNGPPPDWKNPGVHECKWPVGDKLLEDGFFCGKKVQRGSYCALHGAMAYKGVQRGTGHRAGYSPRSGMWR